MPAVQAKGAEGFVTLRNEDRDSTCRLPTAWDALFGCVGTARVRVERPPTVDS